MSDVVIKEWPASFFIEASKKWINGLLALQSTRLNFLSDDKSVCQVIWFEDISAIHCEKCALIFKAVTIEIGKVKYWFSSLPNRLIVYNHIEHFWREQLLPEKDYTATTSKIGKEMLDLAYDSQLTLDFAANNLYSQGKQIENVTSMMSDIHGALEASDRLLRGLESWVGQWDSRTAKMLRHKFPNNIPTRTETLEFSVLFSTGDSPLTNEPHTMGTLQFTSVWVKLMDAQQSIVFHFDSHMICTIRVITPWTMVIKGMVTNQMDRCYSLTCSKLIFILQGLEPFYKDRIHYENPQDIKRALPVQVHPSRLLATSKISDGASSQCQTSNQEVTQYEAEEISKLIGNMKSMAIDIAKETRIQNETLDHLIPSVDQANEKLLKNIRRMDKLM